MSILCDDEESIHYERKTSAFARANVSIFRTAEWKNERASAARENTGFARARVQPPRCLLHHHHHHYYRVYARVFVLRGKRRVSAPNV